MYVTSEVQATNLSPSVDRHGYVTRVSLARCYFKVVWELAAIKAVAIWRGRTRMYLFLTRIRARQRASCILLDKGLPFHCLLKLFAAPTIKLSPHDPLPSRRCPCCPSRSDRAPWRTSATPCGVSARARWRGTSWVCRRWRRTRTLRSGSNVHWTTAPFAG